MEDIYEDILFELGGVAGYFRDVVHDQLKWLPKPNFQIAIGSILAVLTTFFINFFHLRRDTLLSSNPRNKKLSIWLTVPLLIVIGGLIGVMWHVHGVGSLKPGRIDTAIYNVKLISRRVEMKIGSIDVENWEWKEEASLSLELNAGIETGISGLLDERSLEKIQLIAQWDEDLVPVVKDMEEKMAAYQQWLQDIDSAYVPCGLGADFDTANFKVWVENTTNGRIKVANFAKNLKNSTKNLSNSLKDVLKTQGKVDIGKQILQQRLDIMKAMLSSLREDLTRLEALKKQLHQNELEKLPMMRYSLMIKTIVDMACCSLIILAFISILSIVWNQGTVSSADRMDDCVDMTTFITVLSCIVIFLCTQGYFGADQCTLSKSYGFRELTTPFSHENVSLDVCSKQESTFFESLKKDPILPSKPSSNLPIREDKHKLFGLLNAWSVDSRKSSHFGEDLQKMEQLYGRLAALEKSNCSFLDSAQQQSITDYLKVIKPFIDKNSNIKTHVGTIVEEMEPKTRKISDFIQRSHEKMAQSLDRAVGNLTETILSADSSCQPIVDNFAQIRRVVCQAIEDDLENFKWIIFVFLAGCVVACVVQMAVLRLYAFWFVDFGDDEDSDDDFE